MEGVKPRGSFGVPEQMKKDLEAARMRAAQTQAQATSEPPKPPEEPVDPRWQPPPEAPSQIEEKVTLKAPEEKSSDQLSADDLETMYLKQREELEKSLDTKITEEDVKEYVFKGRLAKDIEVLPGIIRCVFQTLSAEDVQEIDRQVADIAEQNKKATPDGLENERAMLNLAYSWVSAAGKPLAANSDPAKRRATIRRMGAHLVDAAIKSLREYNLLLRLVMREKQFLKKS